MTHYPLLYLHFLTFLLSYQPVPLAFASPFISSFTNLVHHAPSAISVFRVIPNAISHFITRLSGPLLPSPRTAFLPGTWDLWCILLQPSSLSGNCLRYLVCFLRVHASSVSPAQYTARTQGIRWWCRLNTWVNHSSTRQRLGHIVAQYRIKLVNEPAVLLRIFSWKKIIASL